MIRTQVRAPHAGFSCRMFSIKSCITSHHYAITACAAGTYERFYGYAATRCEELCGAYFALLVAASAAYACAFSP